MATFAHLSGNIVTNIITADSLEDAELVLGPGTCVEYTAENPAGIGWTYDGTNFVSPVEDLKAPKVAGPETLKA